MKMASSTDPAQVRRSCEVCGRSTTSFLFALETRTVHGICDPCSLEISKNRGRTLGAKNLVVGKPGKWQAHLAAEIAHERSKRTR